MISPSLLLLLPLLLLGAGVADASSHALRYFFTGVSELGHGLPRFVIVGYLDDQQFVHYDSDSRRDLPRGSWIQRVDEDDAQYWDWQTQLSHSWELYFQLSLWNRFNHTPGLHTWQWMHGCELRQDGRKEGSSQFGYDGTDFLSLDKETLTWTAANWRAQVTKRQWEADLVWTESRKNFLEGDCIEWLHKYLNYGKDSLLRKEPPVVTVTQKGSYNGLEILICRLHGFYPKKVDVTWRKGGEILEQETFRGGITPNSDSTYHTWLSIEIDPEEREHYKCHVEHDGLLNPQDFSWEKPVSSATGILVGGVLSALAAVVLLVIGILFYAKKWRKGYQAASGNSEESASSGNDIVA
ncbi:major histocompatibility complex class I-related gene protein-like [Crotalus tigris]|uniref:major histocompatibility complex class I-related gene protein-like n=1 Tax=Crotalus tigris TaxID=88082 RepID=UPI00192F4008|nr:major histocompatibility complex class I-related gene protein-like [Crotalus tigris]